MPGKDNTRDEALVRPATKEQKNILYCSFCGKSQEEVRKLIAGPTVFICDECVGVCLDVINDDQQSTSGFIFRTPHADVWEELSIKSDTLFIETFGSEFSANNLKDLPIETLLARLTTTAVRLISQKISVEHLDREIAGCELAAEEQQGRVTLHEERLQTEAAHSEEIVHRITALKQERAKRLEQK